MGNRIDKPGESIHERVAYALASTRVVGDYLTYQDILSRILVSHPDQAIVYRMGEECFKTTNEMLTALGEPPFDTFDEWLDYGKRMYLKKVGANS